ncbi:hypothetical protein UC8_30680 [Roseimaritima ulvae]|uniref:Cytochrome c domain-containing protein n=2 Tax=Roseimaritima ulvae TaxID=980254 RepID=A0A5B9QTH3_9BACT|nr:hypothetical protein UC8_30680 [Roseimaritima ulvae]
MLLLSGITLGMFSPMDSAADAPNTKVALADGDRVVLLGDGLIEQEQYSGWIETALSAASPAKSLSFRNLGWNADTPSGASRLGLSLVQAGHEPAGESQRLLRAQLELTQPSVLIIGYGMASALESGAEGLETFRDDYQRLLDTAQDINPDVRFVLLSPLRHTDGDPPLNATLDSYTQSIAQLARKNDALFIDLSAVGNESQYRKDPIHLNEAGYRQAAIAISKAVAGDSDAWQTSANTDALRQTIIRKNVWWFHRSRPANMAYVFGFRKREQGQNAVEIPKYDALIAAEESRIEALRPLQPVELEVPEPTTKSQYAEFTPQPKPEFTVADGWEVNLWAENPQLNKPIHMNFDPQGRLWVASSEAYPMIEVGQSAPDKVLILEDTTGDGRADKSTTFADGLLIPTGLAPGDGGVYVAQSTDLLFLQDTDGDERADLRRRVLSGFGTEDTHHNLHTLLWGPDGRLYMNQSVYTRTDTETPRGVVRLKAGGGFRYDTRSMRMQTFFNGLWNPWGHQFDAGGQSFMSDGAGFDGLAWVFPGATFKPTPHARRLLPLISPGRYPKFASLEILSGPSFPRDWQGSIITCDFRANRVTRFSVSDQESGFVTAQEADLLRTATSTFRPIDVKQGPDGALYIADWSNPIINHGEVDFRDPRRDRWHGRIWRMTWKGASPQAKTNLQQLDNTALLDNLLSADRYQRDQSRRVLIERAQDDADPIRNVLASWTAAHAEPSARLQSLWMHQALNLKNVDLLDEVLAASSAEHRAAAVRVLSDWADPASDLSEPLATADAFPRYQRLVLDAHPRVRLEAVRGLDKFSGADAVQIALEALNEPLDTFLEFALAKLVDDSSASVMAAIESGTWTADDAAGAKRLEFVLSAVEPSKARSYLSKYVANNPLDANGKGPWIELIGLTGGPQTLQILLNQTVDKRFDEATTLRALRGLIEAQRLRKQRPGKQLQRIGGLLQSDSVAVRHTAMELVATWKLASLVEALEAIAIDQQTEMPSRKFAVAALRGVGGAKSADALQRILTHTKAWQLRSDAVVALAALDAGRAAPLFYEVLDDSRDEAAAVALWRGVLAMKDAGQTLAGAIPEKGISEASAQAGLRVLRDGGREEPGLLSALKPHAGEAMESEQWTKERIAAMVDQVQQSGDPHRGEAIYRREKLQCVLCHAVGGVGGQVGPDLTSLGASAPVDYIIESLFDPNAKIKEGFHSVVVATEEGQIVTGVVVESTDEELVLRNASAELVRIPVADIVLEKNGPSLMPTGVIDRLKPAEQVDLVRFLTELGKPGPFDAAKGDVARTFEWLAGTHRLEQEGPERIISGQHTAGWKRLDTLVDGSVTKSALEQRTAQYGLGTLVNIYLRTQVSVANDGDVQLNVDSPKPVAMWIDGQRVKLSDKGQTVDVKLEGGEHNVLLRLDARDIPARLRLQSKDVAFATE